MISPLLLGTCVCFGEPIFRHRLPNGRQITCADLRAIDQRLQSSGTHLQEAPRALNVAGGLLQFPNKSGIGV